MTTVNTGGHLGPVSGLYGLRAISATSYWLWQILCQSLGNPSKLVIYLFGTLLTLSPQQLHPPSLFHLNILPLFSSFPLSPTYSPVSLSFYCQSVSLSLLVYPCVFLSLLPLFSSLPPTRSKTPPLFILLLSRSLTSLCSFGALILPHHSLLHFSQLCFPSVLYILPCFLLIFSSVAISFSANNTIFQIFTLIYSTCPISQFSLYFLFLLHFSLTFFLPFLFDHFLVSVISDPFPLPFLLSTFYRLLSHWPFSLMSLSSPLPVELHS